MSHLSGQEVLSSEHYGPVGSCMLPPVHLVRPLASEASAWGLDLETFGGHSAGTGLVIQELGEAIGVRSIRSLEWTPSTRGNTEVDSVQLLSGPD